jgi:hypothetical protein
MSSYEKLSLGIFGLKKSNVGPQKVTNRYVKLSYLPIFFVDPFFGGIR